MFVIGDSSMDIGQSMTKIETGVVDISSDDLREFKNRNPDKNLAMIFAEKVKREHEEYKRLDYKSDVLSVLYIKENHFNTLNRYISAFITVVELFFTFARRNPTNIWIEKIIENTRKHVKEISNFLINYFLKPDYKINNDYSMNEDEGTSQKIIIRDSPGFNTLRNIFDDFGIPLDFSDAIQDYLDNKFDTTSLVKLVSNLMNYFYDHFNKRKEPAKKNNFDDGEFFDDE